MNRKVKLRPPLLHSRLGSGASARAFQPVPPSSGRHAVPETRTASGRERSAFRSCQWNRRAGFARPCLRSPCRGTARTSNSTARARRERRPMINAFFVGETDASMRENESLESAQLPACKRLDLPLGPKLSVCVVVGPQNVVRIRHSGSTHYAPPAERRFGSSRSSPSGASFRRSSRTWRRWRLQARRRDRAPALPALRAGAQSLRQLSPRQHAGAITGRGEACSNRCLLQRRSADRTLPASLQRPGPAKPRVLSSWAVPESSASLGNVANPSDFRVPWSQSRNAFSYP